MKDILGRIVRPLKDGILDQNPIVVQALCLCPAVAVSARLTDSLAMGLCMLAVLILSNVSIAALKQFFPSPVRMPCFMVLIGTFVSVAHMVLGAYWPETAASLGLFLPLMAVGVLLLHETETSASQKNVPLALLSAISAGLGLLLVMCAVGAVRELLGTGALLGSEVPGTWFKPLRFFTLPAGGFVALGLVSALFQAIRNAANRKKEDEPS